MTFIITYNPDGSILSSTQGSATLADVVQGSGELAIEVDGLYNPAQYYVDLNTLTPVPKTAVTATTTLTANTDVTATLSGLPDCDVKYYSGTTDEGGVNPPNEVIATDTVSDGQLNVSSDLAGEYSIVLSAPTFLDTTVVLTVEDT